MPGIYRLQGVLKQYEWGGTTFIPSLLQEKNEEKSPFAEYWMGTHPLGIARVEAGKGEWKPLIEYARDLPFLVKLLDVRTMLSIQVHPDRENAAKEFTRENAAGIPIDSPIRNYKDPNHKPELMVALGDFWLLHGFKPPEELIYTLLNVVELRELLPIFNQSGYTGLYKHVMEIPQVEVNRILRPLVSNIENLYKDELPDRYDEDYWVAKAVQHFVINGDIDRGIFSIYLLNLVHLEKGEGLFQAPGVPHAYLEGQTVEIMANSDNVLRGGLTTKHIDVTELMKHIKCEPTYVQILEPESTSPDEECYITPVSDFRLCHYEVRPGQVIQFTTIVTEILFISEGMAELTGNGYNVLLEPGQLAAMVLPGTEVIIKTPNSASVFRAAAGVEGPMDK